MEQNVLRILVKTDTMAIRDIAKEIDLHPNTITKLIQPNGPKLIDPRLLKNVQKLATRYNLAVKVNVEFEPIEAQ